MKKGVLIILDGYGEGKAGKYNAVKDANTPYLNSLKQQSYSLLKASGEAVGLLDGELGGSEVGHMTIGAGKVIPSTAKQIYDDIKSDKFKDNKTLVEMLKFLKKNKGNLHLIGLMSDKGIHSEMSHCLKLIGLAKDCAKHIFVHFITDGRDTGDFDSIKYLRQFKDGVKDVKNCEIASVSGRAISMDRDGNMRHSEQAFNSMFLDEPSLSSDDLEQFLRSQHKSGKTDQYIEPTHIFTKADTHIKPSDCVFFFNFREDRVRQLLKYTAEHLDCPIFTMIKIGTTPTKYLYTSSGTDHTLVQHLSELNLRQIKISETTKYAHVTYYFNGMREEPFAGEDRVHIPTCEVEDFVTTPKMRAKEIADEAVGAINKGYDAIILNFSNPDMIGHTGNYEAVLTALECVDKCVKKICTEARKKGYFVIVTADHGNAEEMRRPDGSPHSAHTMNRVFCSVLDDRPHQMRKYGELQDIAPTFISLMGVENNPYFEGKNLILK